MNTLGDEAMVKSGQLNENVLKRGRIGQMIAERLAKVPGITSVAIIGSVATGEARANSDLDLVATYCNNFDPRFSTLSVMNSVVICRRLRNRGIHSYP